MEHELRTSTQEKRDLTDAQIEEIKTAVIEYLHSRDAKRAMEFLRNNRGKGFAVEFCLQLRDAYQPGDSAPFIELGLMLEEGL